MPSADRIGQSMIDTQRLAGKLYYHLTKQLVDNFGLDGEKSLRQGLREFGRWRGAQMRKSHEAKGWPINLTTMLKKWDNASGYLIQDDWTDGTWSTGFVEVATTTCYMAQEWIEKDFRRWGHVYCDEIHQSICEAYHRYAGVSIPNNLLKGDDHCRWRWTLSDPEGKGIPGPISVRQFSQGSSADAFENDVHDVVLRTVRIYGLLYYALAKQLTQKFGDAGEQALRQAIRDFAVERGTLLREKHERAGLPVNLESFYADYPLPIDMVWRVNAEEISPVKMDRSVSVCPLRDVWKEVGGERLGAIYCDELYPAMFRAYNETIKVSTPEMKVKGDAVCVLHFDMS